MPIPKEPLVAVAHRPALQIMRNVGVGAKIKTVRVVKHLVQLVGDAFLDLGRIACGRRRSHLIGGQRGRLLGGVPDGSARTLDGAPDGLVDQLRLGNGLVGVAGRGGRSERSA